MILVLNNLNSEIMTTIYSLSFQSSIVGWHDSGINGMLYNVMNIVTDKSL